MNNKPFTLVVNEFEDKLVKVINESGLPAFIMKQSLSKIYDQLTMIENKEIAEYEEKMKGEKAK